MTADRLLSIGRIWLGRFTRPRVATTALSPIHSGTPAATRVPNVIVRRISVTGRESSPALARSSVMVSLTALLALALPNCSTARSGWRFWAAATAASTGSIRSLASTESPATSKSTRAAWPSVRDRALPEQRRLHVLDVRDLRELLRHILDRGLELRILDGELVALDEHDLGLRTKPGAIESGFCIVGLAVEVVDIGDQVRPHRVADRKREDHERKPAPEGLLAVLAAPARHTGREVVRRRMRVHALPFALCGAERGHEAGRRHPAMARTTVLRLREPV